MLELKVKTVAMVEGGAFSILLTDLEEKKILPIMVGPFEAQAIALPLQGEVPARPLTHDLILSIWDNLNCHLLKIVIHDVRDGTFYAQLHLEEGETLHTIDSRPSDAIALAVRCQAPIYMAHHMVEFTYDYEDMVFLEGKEEGDK